MKKLAALALATLWAFPALGTEASLSDPVGSDNLSTCRGFEEAFSGLHSPSFRKLPTKPEK